MLFLRQATAKMVQLGPFVDETDGYTPETGLTIEDTDVYLSTDGGTFANPDDTNDCNEDRDGWYRKRLNGTDLNTLGRLVVMVDVSGARPVYKEYMVMPANVWDSLFGSDTLQVTTGGAGAITFTYTLTSSVDAAPIGSATVWVSTDEAGTNVVASGTTNTSGQVTFYLDAGTYYVWREKAGWNFTNPDTETVA